MCWLESIFPSSLIAPLIGGLKQRLANRTVPLPRTAATLLLQTPPVFSFLSLMAILKCLPGVFLFRLVCKACVSDRYTEHEHHTVYPEYSLSFCPTPRLQVYHQSKRKHDNHFSFLVNIFPASCWGSVFPLGLNMWSYKLKQQHAVRPVAVCRSLQTLWGGTVCRHRLLICQPLVWSYSSASWARQAFLH